MGLEGCQSLLSVTEDMIFTWRTALHDLSRGPHVVILSGKLPFTRKTWIYIDRHTMPAQFYRSILENDMFLYGHSNVATSFLYNFKTLTHLWWGIFYIFNEGYPLNGRVVHIYWLASYVEVLKHIIAIGLQF